jgi:hypothetical protein
MELYGEFRAALEIKEIDDNFAKELFIALEECFQHDEKGIDYLLARIKNEQLKRFIISHGDSPEFKSDCRRQMEDGINKVIMKGLKKRIDDIGFEIRKIERKNGDSMSIDELLSEKKAIDSQIRKLEGR